MARNPISIAGAWITTLSVCAFVTYLALDQFGLLASPYAGLFGFVVVPAIFAVGLVLIPIGIWREARRRRAGHAAWQWPAIDLGQSRTRAAIALITALTLVNITIIAVASLGAVHYSESNSFCGQVCHVPMEPEYTTHQLSPHSKIRCVDCHVIPTAAGFLKAKLNGTRQLYELVTNSYNRPIPSPRDRIPVPAATCERCHAPMEPEREIKRTFREHKDNEQSSEITTTLMMYSGRSHWHARPDVVVEYAATDKTLSTIPYVKVTERGTTTEYFAENVTAPPAGQPLRRMDCLDCHNRPAHTLSASPAQVVDRAIARGEISTKVPFVRNHLVEALGEERPAGTDASQAIADRLTKILGTGTPEARQAVQVAQRLYRENVFPRMKITWGTYTNQLFHINDTGCFRCHTDTHTIKGNPEKKVRQDCELCHKEL
ncbi:MAG TPA: NapC/NirT family cytochrome c [Vicinamibacterales bacterium]|nr:NapC/NirT family cytochrome c [Vicinamibacterales bacterium]